MYVYIMNQPPTSDVQIRHSNVLTNARFEYSEMQLDLFFFIVSRLRKDDTSLIYQLNIKELSDQTGNTYNLTRLKMATEGMIARVFTSLSAERGEAQFTMLQSAVYPPSGGVIEIMLSQLVLSHLFDLKNKFTSLGLQAALRLSSKYSKRIYQLCSQWKDQAETKKYEIQDLKRILSLIDKEGNGKLKAYKDFRKVVPEPSVKQINEHTELNINYKTEKVGKSYKYITFTIEHQVPKLGPPFILETSLEDTPSTPPGVSQQQYENCAKALDEFFFIKGPFRQTILANMDFTKTAHRIKNDIITGKRKDVKNPGGLLLTTLGLVKVEIPKSA